MINDPGAEVFEATTENIGATVGDSAYYKTLMRKFARSKAFVSMNRKKMTKQIDEQWVKTLEAALPAIDVWIRHPGRDISEEEKILPVELSRNISPKSIRHLAQHTNMINRIEDDGSVVPSKLLNVFREENILTYENKFVATLIDKLYIFINRRLDTLKKYAADEQSDELEITVEMPSKNGNIKMNVSVETTDLSYDAEEDDGEEGADIMTRVKRISKIIDSYKASQFAVSVGKNFVRPPIMRTNAITKNIYLKQCLVLWQYIESYDKAGFEIIKTDTAERPPEEMLRQFYSLMAMQYVVFRYTNGGALLGMGENIGTAGAKIAPKVIRKHDEFSEDDYDFIEREERAVTAVPVAVPGVTQKKKLSPRDKQIKKAISAALALERKTRLAEERKKAAAEKAAAKKSAKAKKSA